jgi:hypothetical protein
MDSISQNEIEYLRNNNNTGIEFEYALFYLLNLEQYQTIFIKEVVNHHQFKDRILGIIASTDIKELIYNLKTISWTSFKVKLATQVDDIGPADIILQDSKIQNLGLSVKYQNNCTLNVSSRYFLTEESTIELKNELHNSCKKYISEMISNYGDTVNWFRQRKTSTETDKYIDKIRERVISDWFKKTNDERKELLSKLVHADSPISFWVVKFVNSKNGYKLDLNTNPIKYLDPNFVTLTKEATSYIGFKLNNKLFAKMQVKFNNGILEKTKGNKSDFSLDGILMKMGDPFGSWNFSI